MAETDSTPRHHSFRLTGNSNVDQSKKAVARFSLPQLLSFILACAVFFAALPSIFHFFANAGNRQSASATVFITWAMLALIYVYWRLKSALVVHCFCPLLMSFSLVYIGWHSVDFGWDTIALALPALTLGCIFGMLIGFPVTILIILAGAFDRRTRQKPLT